MKHKILTKATCISAAALAGGMTLANTTSCNKTTNIDDLFFTIKNDNNLEVTFCDRGASIYCIKYKDKVITYHPKDKNVFLRDDYYYGKVLGRMAGRIPDGKLKFNGKEYQLEVNEVSNTKNNSLHGGKKSLNTKDFKHYITEDDNSYRIAFNYVSPANEAGYPEALDSWIVYTIHKDADIMDVNLVATSTGPTPVDLSIHPYFRLDESGDVRNHLLTIPADKMAKYDDNGGQTVVGAKSVTEDEDTPWDFRTAKAIGANIDKAKELDPVSGGYDHIWKFTNSGTGVTNDIILSNPAASGGSGFNLKVTTDADAVIMYANCYPHKGMAINPTGTDGLYSAITIEPYTFFDVTEASINKLVVTPDKPFTRKITFTLTEE